MRGARRSSIPYEQIDVEIRSLVRLVNAFHGIRTLQSCAGHHPETDGYLSFTAHTQGDLFHFLHALPPLRQNVRLVNNWFEYSGLAVQVHTEPRRTVYTIRFHGRPFYMLRQIEGQVEAALAMTLGLR